MSRQRVQQLASEFLARADATGWFEALYAEAGSNYAAVPWADLAPNPNLVDWSLQHNLAGGGKTALTIGCGYGDDAEFLAELGFQVVAFDISPTAIAQCQSRFPNSPVSYQVVPSFRTHSLLRDGLLGDHSGNPTHRCSQSVSPAQGV